MPKQGATQYDAAVGERAEHIRNVLAMSQNEVARRLGVTRQTIANYESGRTPMRADIVRMLCEVYGVSPDWLLGLTGTLVMKRKINGRLVELCEEGPTINSPLKTEKERQCQSTPEE